jgi:hypothetical protein
MALKLILIYVLISMVPIWLLSAMAAVPSNPGLGFYAALFILTGSVSGYSLIIERRRTRLSLRAARRQGTITREIRLERMEAFVEEVRKRKER